MCNGIVLFGDYLIHSCCWFNSGALPTISYKLWNKCGRIWHWSFNQKKKHQFSTYYTRNALHVCLNSTGRSHRYTGYIASEQDKQPPNAYIIINRYNSGVYIRTQPTLDDVLCVTTDISMLRTSGIRCITHRLYIILLDVCHFIYLSVYIWFGIGMSNVLRIVLACVRCIFGYLVARFSAAENYKNEMVMRDTRTRINEVRWCFIKYAHRANSTPQDNSFSKKKKKTCTNTHRRTDTQNHCIFVGWKIVSKYVSFVITTTATEQQQRQSDK